MSVLLSYRSPKGAEAQRQRRPKPQVCRRAPPEQPAVERVRERGVLLVGSTGDYRPLTWRDPETGRWEGFGVEIAERLAAELGVRAEFVQTSWPTLAVDVQASPPIFDLAIGGITITDARRTSMDMSEGYLANGKTILCRAADAKICNYGNARAQIP